MPHDHVSVGVMVFEDAEELDFVGPWEVFAAAAKLNQKDRVVMIGERAGELRCAKGMIVRPQVTFASAPPLDVLVIPGGDGRRAQQKNPIALEWIRSVGARARWVTSVCTGAFLLADAGFLAGKRATTHWSRIDEFKARGDVEVVERTRFVRQGNVVTAAGVSAGIDMSLFVVGQLHGPQFAREVQRYIEYDPAPPYAFEA
jgi:transcriptional regulator GlxA family with amidase domain